ncbi:MAG: DUF3847 domain-containing protein [Oscillospiraceae bacterium]|nr:DUF3847 domain-containing protein [Oscillospiraceae bacterium]
MGFAMYEVRPAGLASLRSEQGADAPCAASRLSLPVALKLNHPKDRFAFVGEAVFLPKISIYRRFDVMERSREELEKELAEAVAKVEQYRHQAQRIENRIRDYQESKQKKRNHRLITRGGAVESVAPEVRGMSEKAFYDLAKRIFSLPEVLVQVDRAADQQEGD